LVELGRLGIPGAGIELVLAGVEIGLVGQVAAALLQEVVHVLNIARIVALAADAPLADRELLALALREIAEGEQPPRPAQVGLIAKAGLVVVIVADADGADRRIVRVESWLGKFGQVDRWSFCLTAARMARGQERR
jgi:hypothetical protein